jgi:phospholipase/carboxylesterase
MEDDRLELAGRLLEAGRITDARQLLETFLKDNLNHIPAWKLYAETWPDPAEQKRVWGYCLRFNPGNLQVQQALTALEAPTPKIDQSPASVLPVKRVPAPQRASGSSIWVLLGGVAIFVLFVVVGVVYILNSQPKDPAPYRHEQPVEYYLYVPKDYSADREWPLFVGIHGSGGSGLSCWNLWQPYAEKEGFILLCPSIPGNAGGYVQDVGEQTVWSAVEEVRREYRVNSRMFLAGFSAGAYFVQGFAYHYPQSVNGLAILSTGYYLEGIQSRVPILVVIGGNDHPDSIRANEQLVSHLKQNGFDVQYEVLPGVGHTVTNKTKTLTIEWFRKTIAE